MADMTKALPAEFALVVACCTWPMSEARSATIRDAAARPLDWDRLLRVAKRHRVEGFVSNGLAQAAVAAPAHVSGQLRDLAGVVAHRSLANAAESVRLQRALDEAGITSAVLKGSAVEILAYGALGMKSAWDIDLLVAPSDVVRAIDCLDHAGYDLVQPGGLGRSQFETWISLARDCECRHRETGVNLELHWRLVDSLTLLQGLSVAAPSQDVVVAKGWSLRTFSNDELFTYLCVHGATHGWSRLKWIGDVAAFLERQGDIERMYRRSLELGAGRCSAQALLLCDSLFNTALPTGLKAELESDVCARWLATLALGVLTFGAGESEIEDRAFGTSGISVSQLILTRSWSSRLKDMAHKWNRGPDLRLYLSIPERLRLFYGPVRLAVWVGRRFRRASRP